MREKAEMICFTECLDLAIEKYNEKKYREAFIHLDNASRSLKELARMQEERKKENEVTLTGYILNRRNFNGDL